MPDYTINMGTTIPYPVFFRTEPRFMGVSAHNQTHFEAEWQ